MLRQRQDDLNFTLSKRVGTYFLRKISVGSSFRKRDSLFQNPRNPEDYPKSTIGIVEYKTSHGVYHSIGTLIGRNLVITATPEFAQQFPHEEYEKRVLDYLKLKTKAQIQNKLDKKPESQVQSQVFSQDELNRKFKNQSLKQKISRRSRPNKQQQFLEFYSSQKYNVTQDSSVQHYRYKFFAQKQRFEQYMSTIKDDKISFITFDNHYIPTERIMYSGLSTSLPSGEYDRIQLFSNKLMFIQLSQSSMDQHYGWLGLCYNERQSLSWNTQNIEHLLPLTQELNTFNYVGKPLICSNKSNFYVVGLSIKGQELLFNNQVYNCMQTSCLTVNYKISKGPNQQSGTKLRERSIFNEQFPDLTIINFKTISSFPSPISIGTISDPYLWQSIRQLIFDENNVSYDFIKKLTRIHLLKLHYCSISSANFGNQHSIHLMKGYWPNLRLLCLNNNKLCIQGLKYLTKGHWPYIQTIKCNNNPIYPRQLISIYLDQIK